MTKVKLSVCIPVFNGENFIEEAIESVLNQSFKDFELIIVDNHSTDQTVSLIKKYNDPRIHFTQNETNIGLIANWNKAIECAQGDYIKILPADDFLYPECLQLQCSILDKDTKHNISIVSARRNIISESGKVLFSRGFSKKEGMVSGFKAINQNVRSGGNIIGEAGSLMFRRELLKKTELFNSDIFYTLDLDLWYKLLLQGNLYVIAEILSAFRISNDSASVKIIKQQQEDISNFIKKIYVNKEYKVSWLNYKIGLLKTIFLTEAKKVLYKHVIK